MIFLAWKVNIVNLLFLFIPSFIAFISLFFLLKWKLTWEVKVKHNEYKLKTIDKIIFSIFILTIIFIIIWHVLFHIPPSIMFMFWLSLIFIFSWFYKKKDNEDNKILAHIHKVEFDAIFFFIWILLMVWSLDYFWLLTKIWELYNILPNYIATYLIWILSSIVDNIPITAAMLKANLPIQDAGWLNMTYAVWSGWSLLLIGSAAWVIAMSKYPEITFNKYLKFLPQIFIAYTIWFILTYYITNIII
jgi:Na+/H+ antiporter NhaD/arsenite permease-like protein